MIFISHRSTDRKFAELLADFIAILGVNKKNIFCSSLPGNGVINKIDSEIELKLQDSRINIIILSRDYFQSVYCLNEEGIIWFQKKPLIILALPEIDENNMYGFIDRNYLIRRFDSQTDLSTIYEQINREYGINTPATILNVEINKVIKNYTSLKTNRKSESQPIIIDCNYKSLTDDEAVILYYLWRKQKRKITNIEEMESWLIASELFDFDVSNGIDLLTHSGVGHTNNESFELEIKIFRDFAKKSQEEMRVIINKLMRHYHASKQTFISLWQNEKFRDSDKLFIAYIIDEKITTFGDRWLEEAQVQDILQWINKNSLVNSFKNEYSSCLQFFINNRLVYPSSFTSYGNAREYTLHKSLKDYLFSKNFAYLSDLILTKELYKIPF